MHATALRVNPLKIVIPLWPGPNLFAVKRRIGTVYPSWLSVYLGVLVGPWVTAVQRCAGPLAKFHARVCVVGELGLGWNYLINIFNFMAAPLFYMGSSRSSCKVFTSLLPSPSHVPSGFRII